MEEYNFCTRCGKELPEGASFCPECGSPVGSHADQQYGGAGYGAWGYDAGGGSTRYETLKTGPSFAFIILIYAILAIIFGASDLVSAITLDEAAYQETIDLVSEILGYDATSYMPAWTDDTPLLMSLSSLCVVLSGVLAACCYVCCKKATSWRNAMILCAAATVAILGLGIYSYYLYMAVLLCVFGAITTIMLYTSKDTFRG